VSQEGESRSGRKGRNGVPSIPGVEKEVRQTKLVGGMKEVGKRAGRKAGKNWPMAGEVDFTQKEKSK